MTDLIAPRIVSRILSKPLAKSRRNRTKSRFLQVEKAVDDRSRIDPLDSGASSRRPQGRTSDAEARVTVVTIRRTETQCQGQTVAPKMVTTVRRTIQAIPNTPLKKGAEFREVGNLSPDEAESLRPPRGEPGTRNPKMSKRGAGRDGRSWRS